jgi:hypothetical protein
MITTPTKSVLERRRRYMHIVHTYKAYPFWKSVNIFQLHSCDNDVSICTASIVVEPSHHQLIQRDNWQRWNRAKIDCASFPADDLWPIASMACNQQSSGSHLRSPESLTTNWRPGGVPRQRQFLRFQMATDITTKEAWRHKFMALSDHWKFRFLQKFINIATCPGDS